MSVAERELERDDEHRVTRFELFFHLVFAEALADRRVAVAKHVGRELGRGAVHCAGDGGVE